MPTHIRPVTVLVVPESIDGLIEVLQAIYAKLGTITLDIEGYEVFRDDVYLDTAKDTIEELEKIAKLVQQGLVVSKCLQGAQS